MNSKIFEIKQKIQELEIEKEKLLQELKKLENSGKNNINQINSTYNMSNSNQLTPIEKIKLFRSLFIGRTDIFARKWMNHQCFYILKIGYFSIKILEIRSFAN